MYIKSNSILDHNEHGNISTILATLVVAVVVVFCLFFYVFGQIVLPNQFGIRQNYFDIPGLLEEGYQENGLLPGLHWKVPFLSTVHLLQRDFQVVHLNDRSLMGDLDLAQLEIPTTDGSKVKTDLTLVLRFFDSPRTASQADNDRAAKAKNALDAAETVTEGNNVPFAASIIRSHGGPKELINKYRTVREQQLRIFAITSEESIKKALSTLSTTDYYNPELRETAALRAAEMVNADVNPDGIELWAMLIRRYVYSEKNIDNQIFAKNLQEATEQLNKAERGLEQARAQTEMTQAAWDAEIKDLKVAGEQDMKVIRSEGDRYEVEKRSEGDRLVEESLAGVDKAKNEVLTNVKGADVYIAREMTPLLETLEGGIVTDIDPYDVDQWMRKLISQGSRK